MRQAIVLLVVAVVCSSIQSSLCATSYSTSVEEYQTAFTTWMHGRSKAYTVAEFRAKFEAFMKNFDFVLTHNAGNDKPYEVALNDFADLTSEEYKAYYLNSGIGRQAIRADFEFTGEGHVPRATTVDWRTSGGVVTAIKDQKQCGSCWTFATAGAIESTYAISTGILTTLSEQNLLDCVGSTQTCNGGDPQVALQYVKNNGGIAKTSSYPYTGTKATCVYTASMKGADISGYAAVTSGSESALMAAVNNQPVIVAIDASHQSFQLYKTGRYVEPACSSALANLDHAVFVVGYSSDSTGDYWIIKNSWGTGWGISGYLYLARNANNMCGVATYAYYPTRTSTSTTTAKSATTAVAAASTTTAKATTGSTSTTGGTATPIYIFQDTLSSTWTLTASASVTGLTKTATGYSGAGISASVPTSGSIIFTSSAGVPINKLYFFIKTSAAITVNIGLPGYNPISVQSTGSTSWSSWTLTLAGVSVSSITFSNGGSPCTIFLDNISWS